MPTKLLQLYLQSCVWVFATLWTVVFHARLSMGFCRQEYWSGLPCPPPGDLTNPGMELTSLRSPALAGRFFTASAIWKAQKLWKSFHQLYHSVIYMQCMPAKSLQSCLTFCNHMDCSPPGSSVHGILQKRIMEWVAISSSRGSSQPRDRTHVSCIGWQVFHTTEPPGRLYEVT